MQRFTAPASTGNFTVGFDLLGLALQPVDGSLLGDVLDIESEAASPGLRISGRYAHQLPSDNRDNLILTCLDAFAARIGRKLPGLSMHLQKNLPVGSGLGSSACSIVVACYAFNHYFGNPLSETEALRLMAECEGRVSGSVHYDNVAPSLRGGLQLMLPGSAEVCRALPWFDHWRVVVCYPGTVISTQAARDVLPQNLPRAVAIEYAGLLSRFVSALYTRNESEALASLRDVLAEPRRLALIPELPALRALFSEAGIPHLGISGSGPTLFALCTGDAQAESAADLFRRHYEKNPDAMTHICRMAEQGARAL
jgi:homoserine kinase